MSNKKQVDELLKMKDDCWEILTRMKRDGTSDKSPDEVDDWNVDDILYFWQNYQGTWLRTV